MRAILQIGCVGLAVPGHPHVRRRGVQDPDGSMERTLLVGDFLLVNKMVYGAEVPFTHFRLPGFREPQRGDVIVFKWPADPRVNFVKRLVGLPGDTLLMRDGVLIRNGVALKEPYVTHSSVRCRHGR